MWQYIVRRILLMIPTLLGAAILVFMLMNIVPGDIALLIIGGDQGGDIDPQELENLREQLGLSRPLYMQFLSWLWGLVRLDLGTSLWTGAAVLEELVIRFPLTLQLALMSTVVSTLIAIPWVRWQQFGKTLGSVIACGSLVLGDWQFPRFGQLF